MDHLRDAKEYKKDESIGRHDGESKDEEEAWQETWERFLRKRPTTDPPPPHRVMGKLTLEDDNNRRHNAREVIRRQEAKALKQMAIESQEHSTTNPTMHTLPERLLRGKSKGDWKTQEAIWTNMKKDVRINEEELRDAEVEALRQASERPGSPIWDTIKASLLFRDNALREKEFEKSKQEWLEGADRQNASSPASHTGAERFQDKEREDELSDKIKESPRSHDEVLGTRQIEGLKRLASGGEEDPTTTYKLRYIATEPNSWANSRRSQSWIFVYDIEKLINDNHSHPSRPLSAIKFWRPKAARQGEFKNEDPFLFIDGDVKTLADPNGLIADRGVSSDNIILAERMWGPRNVWNGVGVWQLLSNREFIAFRAMYREEYLRNARAQAQVEYSRDPRARDSSHPLYMMHGALQEPPRPARFPWNKTRVPPPAHYKAPEDHNEGVSKTQSPRATDDQVQKALKRALQRDLEWANFFQDPKNAAHPSRGEASAQSSRGNPPSRDHEGKLTASQSPRVRDSEVRKAENAKWPDPFSSPRNKKDGRELNDDDVDYMEDQREWT